MFLSTVCSVHCCDSKHSKTFMIIWQSPLNNEAVVSRVCSETSRFARGEKKHECHSLWIALAVLFVPECKKINGSTFPFRTSPAFSRPSDVCLRRSEGCGLWGGEALLWMGSSCILHEAVGLLDGMGGKSCFLRGRLVAGSFFCCLVSLLAARTAVCSGVTGLYSCADSCWWITVSVGRLWRCREIRTGIPWNSQCALVSRRVSLLNVGKMTKC